jgi:hypothetical protein
MSEKLKMEADPTKPETMTFTKEDTHVYTSEVSQSFSFPCHCCKEGRVTVIVTGNQGKAYHRVVEDLTSPETIKMATDAYAARMGKTKP